MFLKNSWNKASIKTKIFIVTASFILSAFAILYIFMYTFMPRFYNKYKTNLINENSSKLVNEIEDTKGDISSLLYNFSYENNVLVKLIDSSGNVVFMPQGRPFNFNHNKFSDKGKQITVEKDFKDPSNGKKYTLEVSAIYKPIDEASKALSLFTPFMIIIALIVSFILAKVYSKFIAKPIIDINEYTKRIAHLDFLNKIKSESNDEISELYANLNNMSEKLEQNILELENANLDLKSDIEKERIQEKNRKEFIATISHELKSPLTILVGQLEGMQYNIGKFKDRDKYLGETVETVEEMKELVNEILSLSKLESSQSKLVLEEVCIGDLVEQIVYELQYFSKEKNLNIKLDIANEIWILVDKKLFKRAINNIILNAFKYTNDSQIVYIILTEKYLEVKNMGTNILAEDLKNIFKAFYRVDKSRNRKTGGTGLGLYIVKNILEKHEFRYEMISKDNSVSFNIYFKTNFFE
ncbi:HAMP domain-containing sensor histidine kinase [uncultured Clostridium sp.]|jgi:two-component system sensor histidine kinase VanS|uniref:HAMP domain-containing sensor histidine kinase n=1 Tax=uncultured Clostridium sp. TaxID=59620 RepID=UPI00261CD0E2|nr:HAMP domain-containing sensor histidine kinase [uncultured Clostridium sp.]